VNQSGAHALTKIAYLDMTSAAAERLAAEYANADDRQLASQYRHPHGSQQRLMVRVLLRAMLARHYPTPAQSWRILRDPLGAPHLAAEGLTTPAPFVSLSHSGDLVACAISNRARLGIDIERIRPDRQVAALAGAAFGPAEAAAVEAAGIDAFYRIWTLREALAKASGGGFGLLVNRIDMIPPGSSGATAHQSISGSDWDFSYWRLAEPYGLGLVRRASPVAKQVPVPQSLSGPPLGR
jgi:4'-phosphopantetheinyl transferase